MTEDKYLFQVKISWKIFFKAQHKEEKHTESFEKCITIETSGKNKNVSMEGDLATFLKPHCECKATLAITVHVTLLSVL